MHVCERAFACECLRTRLFSYGPYINVAYLLWRVSSCSSSQCNTALIVWLLQSVLRKKVEKCVFVAGSRVGEEPQVSGRRFALPLPPHPGTLSTEKKQSSWTSLDF